jgi:hypothetical protein
MQNDRFFSYPFIPRHLTKMCHRCKHFVDLESRLSNKEQETRSKKQKRKLETKEETGANE